MQLIKKILKQTIYIFIIGLIMEVSAFTITHDFYIIFLLLTFPLFILGKLFTANDFSSKILSLWRYSFIPTISLNLSVMFTVEPSDFVDGSIIYFSNRYLIDIGTMLSVYFFILIGIYLVKVTNKKTLNKSSS